MNIISPDILALAALLYVTLLFYIAWRGDRLGSQQLPAKSALVYSLSLAVYCSSWTFFGAVGTASSHGWGFFAIYLGPILLFLLGYRLVQRIILISKQQNITSVSDFISSRYGKSRLVAILVTVIAVFGSLPYISLQLHAIALAFDTVTSRSLAGFSTGSQHPLTDTAFYSAVLLAGFTILFGTRHHNATEHHRGLIQAIAFESVVKLLAILAVGVFCLRLLPEIPLASPGVSWLNMGSTGEDAGTGFSFLDFTVRMLLSMVAILFLPRQFHVTVVEADNHHQVMGARWLLPAYLILVSLAVIPIALAGNLLLPGGGNADLFVLILPLSHGENLLVTAAFIGGISAATGMVIVAAISLSTMVCNDIVMPMLIYIRRLNILRHPGLSRIILTIRRISIALILLCSYGYFRLSDTSQGLANIGLVSFAATMQFAPAALAGLYWRGANRRGAVAGLILGFITWGYCLLLPTLLGYREVNLIFGETSWLHPHHLFGVEDLSPLVHGVFWSMAFNIGALILGSIRFRPSLLDRIQASVFLHTTPVEHPMPLFRGEGHHASVHDARTLCRSILGETASDRIFGSGRGPARHQENDPVPRELVQEIERSIASVIGASSARHVVAKTLLGRDISAEDLVVMLDETSQAITFNRELLQSGFEHISQGVSVIDRHQKLVAWNTRFVELLEFPEDFLYVGMPVEEVLRYNAARGEYGEGNSKGQVARRMEGFRSGKPHSEERKRPNGRYIRSQGNPMPGGGFVTSYTDITDTVNAEELLRKANESLEIRVMERTRDLEELNRQLQEVTEGKTRFLAAASHDLLQPINAARLFNQNILEQCELTDLTIQELTSRVDRSLVNADRLLRALLDISKLDAGSITPELSVFDIHELLEELALEMEPLAEQKGLTLQVRNRHIGVCSDRRLLRSMVQNLITNAIRYTPEGGVLVGCRLRGSRLSLEIYDTGIGIRKEDLERIFREFHRVQDDTRQSDGDGLGLGLAITHRLSQMLEHPVTVRSEFGRGSRFSISVPVRRLQMATRAEQEPRRPASRLSGLRVLCLEDALETLEAMEVLLKLWGCQVISCPDIATARAALGRTDPEVVIADYNLEDTETGLDLLREACPPGRVGRYGVMISAEQDPSIRSRAHAEGMYFLTKPVDPSSLRTLLRRAMAERPGEDPAWVPEQAETRAG